MGVCKKCALLDTDFLYKTHLARNKDLFHIDGLEFDPALFKIALGFSRVGTFFRAENLNIHRIPFLLCIRFSTCVLIRFPGRHRRVIYRHLSISTARRISASSVR